MRLGVRLRDPDQRVPKFNTLIEKKGEGTRVFCMHACSSAAGRSGDKHSSRTFAVRDPPVRPAVRRDGAATGYASNAAGHLRTRNARGNFEHDQPTLPPSVTMKRRA